MRGVSAAPQSLTNTNTDMKNKNTQVKEAVLGAPAGWRRYGPTYLFTNVGAARYSQKDVSDEPAMVFRYFIKEHACTSNAQELLYKGAMYNVGQLLLINGEPEGIMPGATPVCTAQGSVMGAGMFELLHEADAKRSEIMKEWSSTTPDLTKTKPMPENKNTQVETTEYDAELGMSARKHLSCIKDAVLGHDYYIEDSMPGLQADDYLTKLIIDQVREWKATDKKYNQLVQIAVLATVAAVGMALSCILLIAAH